MASGERSQKRGRYEELTMVTGENWFLTLRGTSSFKTKREDGLGCR